ncbi:MULTISPECIES: MipA/OmpV family protein [unclassified Roseitalea]|uniref:MipA/OmpV family protein n=1 Tax=unclassified Roseitalea TaxID=2639107 RepID=UPI00273E9919|nr:MULTISPECIES: MipA/OmpV family protein [unclassified Roseitalea]
MTTGRTAFCAAAIAMAFGLAKPAVAQGWDDGAAAPGIKGEIGIGVSVTPLYEGSTDFKVSPLPLIRIERLTLSNGFQIGGREGGFSLGPSFNLRGPRTGDDTPALMPLADVDRAFEFGLEASYEAPAYRIHANLRRGFGGHQGWVGEAGADVIVRPSMDVTLLAGPRVSYADDSYMDTYFSVPAGTAGFAAYDADAGIKSVGVELGARRELGPDWAIEGKASYDRLVGDAASSPITAIGTRDQFGVAVGLVRKFDIAF